MYNITQISDRAKHYASSVNIDINLKYTRSINMKKANNNEPNAKAILNSEVMSRTTHQDNRHRTINKIEIDLENGEALKSRRTNDRLYSKKQISTTRKSKNNSKIQHYYFVAM